MENMLNIAAIAANDWNVWTCNHCESCNFGDTKVCIVCDMGRWTSCDIECEHNRPAPASVCVKVDLEDRNEVVQVPLPYMHAWQVPANYKEFMDVEREGALQLEMRLF